MIIHSQFVKFREDIGNGYLIDFVRCDVAPDHVVDVVVYEAIRFAQPEGLIELQDQSGIGGRTTKNRSEADIYLKGDIRWDGCSNWSLHPIDNCRLHLCDPSGADELAWLIKTAYDIAKDFMPWTEYDVRFEDHPET